MYFSTKQVAGFAFTALQFAQFVAAHPHPSHYSSSLDGRSFDANIDDVDNPPDEDYGIAIYKRSDTTVNPLSKRALFNTNNIQDQGRRDALNQGLRDAVAVAVVALANMGLPAHSDKVTRWFGPNADPAVIRGVFNTFVGSNTNGEGAAILADVNVWNDDYYRIPSNRDPARPMFCVRVNSAGQTGTAYYKPTRDANGVGAFGLHFCDKFYTRVNLATYIPDTPTGRDCSSLGDRITTDLINRRFQGANVLHEFMHVPSVGGQFSPNTPFRPRIDDFAYGAWDLLQFSSNANAINNADTYVYFAMHIFLEVTCNRQFQYPGSTADN